MIYAPKLLFNQTLVIIKQKKNGLFRFYDTHKDSSLKTSFVLLEARLSPLLILVKYIF